MPEAMPSHQIELTDHFDEFVATQIATGRFRDASEVLRAGLSLLELQAREDEERLAELRRLAEEGFKDIEEGRGIEFDSPEELREFISEIGRRARRKAAGFERTAGL
ncbi:MAG: type II toxin-antitoxin system ParD family antitoxin [Pirellulales bacterium]|nr:type II toxin-antitoxin system ParD family antitoxin [Pirellulales bacterium]